MQLPADPQFLPVSRDEMVEELRRELRQRRKAYPTQVVTHRMSRPLAGRRIEIIEAVIALLEGLPDDPGAMARAERGG
jgi:hypothetical protein